MAFTGTAVVKKISDSIFRITGLSLAAAAAGTIGLVGGAGEVDVNAPDWGEYSTSGVHGGAVGLQESVSVDVQYADAAATNAEPVAVVETGNDVATFLATLTNRDAAASGALVITLRYHT